MYIQREERNTGRDDKCKNRLTDKRAGKDKNEIDIEIDRYTYIKTDRYIGRQTDTDMHRQINRYIDKQMNKYTYR